MNNTHKYYVYEWFIKETGKIHLSIVSQIKNTGKPYKNRYLIFDKHANPEGM